MKKLSSLINSSLALESVGLTSLLGKKLVLEADEATPVPEQSAEETPTLPSKKDEEGMKTGSVSINDIIEKLNTIRSGKSFKDAQVRASLDEYFMSLKMPEKVALFAFLKGISQLLTGEIPPEKAVEPEDPAPSIKMKKQKYSRELKPTVVRPIAGKVEKARAPKEDTAAPTPTPIKAKTS